MSITNSRKHRTWAKKRLASPARNDRLNAAYNKGEQLWAQLFKGYNPQP